MNKVKARVLGREGVALYIVSKAPPTSKSVGITMVGSKWYHVWRYEGRYYGTPTKRLSLG